MFNLLWIAAIIGTAALIVLNVIGIIAIPWIAAFLPVLIATGITVVILTLAIVLVRMLEKYSDRFI
jgi:hypothetical protein